MSKLNCVLKINVIPTKVSQLENDAGYLTSLSTDYVTEEELDSKGYLTAIPDEYVTEDELNQSVEGLATKSELSLKQDIIPDLETIREGSELGTTALQSFTETDPVYTADKPSLALKSEIPTKVSELQNDRNYQTASDVAATIAQLPQFEIEIVQALPSTGEKMVLYLVPKDGSSLDVYNEYIWIESTSTFELIGSTTIDLSDYYTKTETNNLLNSKQNSSTAVKHAENTSVGSSTYPVYVDKNGEVVQCNFPTNSLSTVGKTNTKLYLAGGASQGTYVTGCSNINNFIDTDNTLNTVTAPVGDNSTKVATTAFVKTAISSALGDIGEVLDSINGEVV